VRFTQEESGTIVLLGVKNRSQAYRWVSFHQSQGVTQSLSACFLLDKGSYFVALVGPENGFQLQLFG